MNFIEQHLKDVWVIEPKVYQDGRGYFMESFKRSQFEEIIGEIDFIQENESLSLKNVLRGLHYQKGEYSQAKLVRVMEGSVLDVIVDLRRSSPTFGKSLTIELSSENKRQLFIPRGFAHGFLVTSDKAIFQYKIDNIYNPESEVSIAWNDKDLSIDWQIVDDKDLIISDKDMNANPFREAEYF